MVEHGNGQMGLTSRQGTGLILAIDDEQLLLSAIRRMLEADSQQVRVAGPADFDAHLCDAALDVVLLDLNMGRTNGLDVLDRLKRERPEVEVVVMTGDASIESAVGCMRRGAFDYLAKPFDAHRVRTTVRKAVERRRLVRRNLELEQELRGRSGLAGLVGSAPPMQALGRTIRSLRLNESSILLTGESGTGKELVARSLHATSPRSDGPFVPVDCGALPETIIESELFGHEKGAFTGANGSIGLFRMAEGGTLFLDEIGELPLSAQSKLLRALQHKEVRPVGGTTPVPVDIRIISATHRDLAALVADGSFRADLYYRLVVVELELPPLRARRSDVPLLAHHFLEKHAKPPSTVVGIEEDALEALAEREWPGNVRELENTIESAVALAPGPKLRRIDLLPKDACRQRAGGAGSSGDADLPLSLEAYERRALERALRESDGDARAAASRLGIGRSTFYRKLAQTRCRAEPSGRAAAIAGTPADAGLVEP